MSDGAPPADRAQDGQAQGNQWQLGLAEEVELPGWVWLPEDLDAGERAGWVDEVVPVVHDLVGEEQADGTPTTAADIRVLLEMALDERAGSDSYAMYLIWPVRAAAAVMCHVNRVATEDLPDLESLEGRRYATDARYLGPGLQISSRLAVDTDDGPREAAAVHLVFADETDAVVVSLDPSMPQLVGHAMVGLGLFVNALEVTRGDGTAFRGTAPSGLVTDEEWDVDTEGAP